MPPSLAPASSSAPTSSSPSASASPPCCFLGPLLVPWGSGCFLRSAAGQPCLGPFRLLFFFFFFPLLFCPIFLHDLIAGDESTVGDSLRTSGNRWAFHTLLRLQELPKQHGINTNPRDHVAGPLHLAHSALNERGIQLALSDRNWKAGKGWAVVRESFPFSRSL